MFVEALGLERFGKRICLKQGRACVYDLKQALAHSVLEVMKAHVDVLGAFCSRLGLGHPDGGFVVNF